MPVLSDAGVQLVQQLSQRHNVSADAVTHMLIAIQNGNGSMAQFNHPEFGGCGQWMQGGMTMVSDLFNNHLKYRVDSICNDLANELSNHQFAPFSGSFQSQSQNGADSQTQAAGVMGSGNDLFAPDPEANWWPQDLGAPNALGSQNSVRYAYFANSRRLAVKTGDDIWVYDTGDHMIGGFSQQQGTGGSITFTSQFGTVNLPTLPVVSRNGVAAPPAPVPTAPPVVNSAPADSMAVEPSEATDQAAVPFANENNPAPTPTDDLNVATPGSDSILETLERLGGLRDQGYLTEEEFSEKKIELLNRL